MSVRLHRKERPSVRAGYMNMWPLLSTSNIPLKSSFAALHPSRPTLRNLPIVYNDSFVLVLMIPEILATGC